MKTHLFYKINRNFERFENSYAMLPFETHCGTNSTMLAISKTFEFFGEQNLIIFPKKTKTLNALRSLKQNYHLKHILEKTDHV